MFRDSFDHSTGRLDYGFISDEPLAVFPKAVCIYIYIYIYRLYIYIYTTIMELGPVKPL